MVSLKSPILVHQNMTEEDKNKLTGIIKQRVESSAASNLSQILNYQRVAGRLCDLTIRLESAECTDPVYGHYAVVSAQSKFIGCCKLFVKAAIFSIRNPLNVLVRGFDCHQCLRSMMDFMYGDDVYIDVGHHEHFVRLGKILAISDVVEAFEPSTKIILDDDDGNVNDEKNAHVTQQEAFEFTIGSVLEGEPSFFKIPVDRKVEQNSKINYCVGCEFTCYRVQDLMQHMADCEASYLKCSLCAYGFYGWRQYDEHMRKHSADMKRPFFCIHCDMRLPSRAAHVIHLVKHSTEATHCCPQCPKRFKWKQGLTSHMLTHDPVKMMLCDVCGYSTRHMKTLKAHYLRHTGTLLKCEYPGCTHTANRKENLTIHMTTHLQERPYVCEVCGCKFSQSKNLKRHALTHDSEGSAKRFKCSLCAYATHRTDRLKEHEQNMHTEKVVQLELPELVENSFELVDPFDLPLEGAKAVPPTKQAKVAKKRGRKPKAAAAKAPTQAAQRRLAPKPEAMVV